MRLTRRQFAKLLPASGLALAVPDRPAQAQIQAAEAPDVGPTVTLVMAGDVMLADLPGESIARGIDPFAEFADVLNGADLAVGNLECVVSDKGAKVDKSYNFRADPKTLPLLAKYFDGVSLANNHSGDFGKEAFADCVDRLERAKIGFFGGGRNFEEAHRPLVLERKGVKIALLGYDEFRPQSFEAGPDTPGVAWSLGDAYEARVLADITAARSDRGVELVIPFMHWGWEGYPSNVRQESFARRMIDAGADVVVGGHPHVTQGFDSYKGKLIVYSLGNFVFDNYDDGRKGWLLRLTLGKRGLVRWDTVVLRTDAQGTPHPVPDASSPRGRVVEGKVTAS